MLRYVWNEQILTVFCRFENAIWILDFSRRFSISCLNMEKDFDKPSSPIINLNRTFKEQIQGKSNGILSIAIPCKVV